MSFENRANDPTNAVPVYTVYSGSSPGPVNYGFHQQHPQAPPPKYEDVVKGNFPSPMGRAEDLRNPPQPPPTCQEPEHQGVILIAPAYKYSWKQKTFALIFTIFFVIFSTSIMVKLLRLQN